MRWLWISSYDLISQKFVEGWDIYMYQHLASPLCMLSSQLRHMDRQEEALEAMQEAVELYRQLAADRPAAFNPLLALSLNNLSLCLSDLHHQEDAVKAIQEAVNLYKQLAAERPTIFSSHLERALRILSKLST